MRTCLGDEYSDNWMRDAEHASIDRSIESEYAWVRDETRGSHVMEFGDPNVARHLVYEFIAPSPANIQNTVENTSNESSLVRAYDTELDFLYNIAVEFDSP